MKADAMIERFPQYFERSASSRRDKVALVVDGRSATYGELLDMMLTIADTLHRLGIPAGARVAIYSEMSVHAVAAAFGILKAGYVLACIRHTINTAELEQQIADCGASALVASRSTSPRIASRYRAVTIDATRGDLSEYVVCFAADGASEAGNPSTDDAATIFYTSGSTGDSKGVLVTHRIMIAAFRSVSGYLANSERDIVLSFSPGLSSDYGFYNTVMPLLFGGRAVVETALPASAAAIVDIIERHGVTGLHVFPPALFRLCESGDLPASRLQSLRYVSTSGQAFPGKYIRLLRRALPAVLIYCNYGSTECKRIAYLPPAELDRRIGSVGKAIPGIRTYLVGNDNALVVRPWEVGELAVAGDLLMEKYWGRESDTARVIREGCFGESRVFMTGDLFAMDEDGFLFFQCRKGDLFDRDGVPVNPRAVERVLLDHESVAEALVVPVSRSDGARVPKAYVVPAATSAANAIELLDHCRRHLDSAAVPASIDFLRALPRTFGGKVSAQGLN
ncbi:class I adenylate-forming enzyme family protein [Burkholderia ambifaria]|uniref:class I adenylate-forming enzyme family protein n=1 Tax=Burkholderia ambifaria TaxID=152480 RepID=UPI001ABB2450|nr:class I adenylate-forming enzyme family protein [Burkholderia ambifaria]